MRENLQEALSGGAYDHFDLADIQELSDGIAPHGEDVLCIVKRFMHDKEIAQVCTILRAGSLSFCSHRIVFFAS